MICESIFLSFSILSKGEKGNYEDQIRVDQNLDVDGSMRGRNMMGKLLRNNSLP